MRNFFQYGLILLSLGGILLLGGCSDTCQHPEFSSVQVAATCEKEGYTLHTCSDCSYQYKSDFTPPTGHTLLESLFAPTCTEQGFTYYSCACGYSYRAEYVPPTGHSYTEQTVAATCEAEGYTLHTCSVCETSYKTEIHSALGHDLTQAVHSNSCTEAGYTEYTCTRGDLTYRADMTPPTGHHLTTTHILHPTKAQIGSMERACTDCSYHFSLVLDYTDVFANAYTDNTQYLAKGVDISYHNHAPNSNAACGYDPLNWQNIKAAGFDFAILRAGYIGNKDVVFDMNYVDAKAAGMDLGVYYFSYAKNAEQALEEAEELIGWLSGKQFEYPIYFDMEHSSCLTNPSGEDESTEERRERLTEACLAFMEALREAGYYSALYTNNTWLVNYLDAEALKEYGELWYARYPNDPYQKTDMSDEEFKAIEAAFKVLPTDDSFAWNTEKYGKQVGMWQYTQHGVIENSGMDQKVDMNYAFKDYPSLIKKFCLNGYTAQPQS